MFRYFELLYIFSSRDEYLITGVGGTDEASNERKKRNRKILRLAIFFLMVQSTVTPDSKLMWVHSLMAFEFLLDCYKVIFKQTQTPGNQGATNDNANNNTGLAGYFAIYLDNIYLIGKGVLAANILFYQCFYLNKLYFVVTLIYFLLIQKACERPLIRLLEFLQLDFFEGMEQYIVKGVLAFTEILMCFVFTIAVLFLQKQLLMLVALYTNIYSSIQEFARDYIPEAFATWASMAQFSRATREELDAQDDEDVCPICLSAMRTSARKTRCGHLFHGQCIRRALKEKPFCPLCATNIVVQ